MISYLGRALRRISPSAAKFDPPVVAQPEVETARVIVAALGPDGLRSQGKVSAGRFFPPFSAVLAEHGVSTRFARTAREVRRLARGRAVVVHVYGEVQHAEPASKLELDLPAGTLVFNDPRMGRIIAHKRLSHDFLASRGIPMPDLVDAAGGPVFSNEVQASGAAADLVEAGAPLDPVRYNTRFIDTRVTFDSCGYYTTVRLMCVGSQVLHAFVRARPASDASPSVHAKDTPLDADLIEGLQARLAAPNREEFGRLAGRLAQALGPGFYSYDLLVEQPSGRIFLAESGFKFNDMADERRLRPIAEDLPSHRILFSDEFARRSAHAFLEECRALGQPLTDLAA